MRIFPQLLGKQRCANNIKWHSFSPYWHFCLFLTLSFWKLFAKGRLSTNSNSHILSFPSSLSRKHRSTNWEFSRWSNLKWCLCRLKWLSVPKLICHQYRIQRKIRLRSLYRASRGRNQNQTGTCSGRLSVRTNAPGLLLRKLLGKMLTSVDRCDNRDDNR